MLYSTKTMKMTYWYRQRSIVDVDSHLAPRLYLPSCPTSHTRPAYKIYNISILILYWTTYNRHIHSQNMAVRGELVILWVY